MGYPWMMFTQYQGRELIDNTNHAWTSLNGINGRIFYNKTDPYKSIFIPGAGRFANTMNDSVSSYGYYWSSTRDTTTQYGVHIQFTSDFNTMTYSKRYVGYSIRSVASKRPW